MRHIQFSSVAATALAVIASWPALAKDDPKHPAYDYEPSTQQADTADHQPAAAKPAQAADEADPRYPAAYFTPQVVYNDPTAGHK